MSKVYVISDNGAVVSVRRSTMGTIVVLATYGLRVTETDLVMDCDTGAVDFDLPEDGRPVRVELFTIGC